MRKLRLGVLASGSGSNLQAIMDNCESRKIDAQVVVVISDKEEAFALQRARNKEIPAYHLNPKGFAQKTEYEEELVKILQEHQIDLVILAGYMRLVGKRLLESYPQRIINIHPALLPAFPGTHGQKDAFEYGVKFSGCTVHFVDEGMDTGPIIKQAVVPVLEDDTVDDLSARILKEEHRIFSEAIQLYAQGKLEINGRKVRIQA
jgi:phosphoribosylglycinamide formyltransferase 1